MSIGVNDGHTISGPGSGAIGKISESEHTRLVGNEVRAMLAQRGHNAINCTVDYANSQSEALSLIVQQANREDLEWFIAIHFNAAGGRGVECYTYEGRQYPDAVEICSNISALGFVNRGVKSGTGLYVVRKTKAKAVLIEVCFVDTEDADHYLEVGHQAIAKAIVDALVGYVEAPQAAPVEMLPQPVIEQPQPIAVAEPVVKINEEVLNLQKNLNRILRGVVKEDGIMGPKTRGAVIKLQGILGLTQDGIPGAKTWAAIGEVYAKTILKVGSNGTAVKYLQWRVGADTDGIFGWDTNRHVAIWQGQNGLKQDGIVGPNTWVKLIG